MKTDNGRTLKSRVRKLQLATLIAGVVGISGQAGALIDVAQSPLLVTTTIKTNLMVVLDDSGSMSFETLTPTNDGALYWQTGATDSFSQNDGSLFFGTGGRKSSYIFPFTEGPGGGHFVIPPFAQFGFMRSAAYNSAYFNPNETYLPWPDFGGFVFDNMDPTQAVSDPSGSTGNANRQHNLTSDFEFTNEGFHFNDGMVIPAGTRYRNSGNSGWITAAADTVFGGGDGSERGVDFYPAFYYTPVFSGGFSINTTVVGDCSTPDPLMYKAFERQPGGLAGLLGADVDALGPDGVCLQRTDIAGGTPEMQNFANWFSYYRKRHLAVRNGIMASFRDLQLGMNVGYFTINNRNTVTMRNFDNNPAFDERNSFLSDIVGENFGGGTPNRQAMQHAGEQFERTTNPIVEFECQKNFSVFFTDGFSSLGGIPTPGNLDGDNGPPYADGISNAIADIAIGQYENMDVSGLSFPVDKQGDVPIPPACQNATLPTPLDCNTDTHVNTYVVTLNGLGTIFGRTHNDVLDAYQNPPAWPDVNADRDPTQIDDLYHAAVNGRGRMLNAASPTDIADQFIEALADIVSRSVPRTALKATTSRVDTFSRLFQAGFDSDDFSGELIAINLDGTLIWSAANELGSRTAPRTVLSYSDNGGIDLSYSFLDTPVQTSMLADLRSRFTTAQLNGEFGGSDAGHGNGLLDYIKGETDAEVQNGGILRNRNFLLGDIVNSEPLVSGAGNEGWGRLSGTEGSSYRSFIGTLASPGPKSSRPSTIFVGANDGMMHAFDTASGFERFAYVPRAVVPLLPQLADPTYNHRFFVDATPRVADAYDGSWKVVMLSGLGAGGRAMFAMDVTNPASTGPSDVLWEFSSIDDTDLGLTFGQPVITRAADGTWIAIFGNGYNSANEDGVLFIVNLFTGALVSKLETGTGDAANPAGLGSPRVEMDPATGLFAANVYVGDLQGNMWKFDISSTNTAQWGSAFNQAGSARPLFVARSPNGNQPQPITAAANLARHPKGGLLVYFGTGRYLANSDNQSPPGTRIETFYAILDEGTDNNIDRGDLTPIPIIDEIQVNGRNTRRIQEETVNLSDVRGFYMDLAVNGDELGERVLRPPQVRFGRLIFATFEPTQSACISGGKTRLYFLNALTGAGKLPIGDCTDCGTIELDIGSPTPPPVVIDVTKEEDIAFCVQNPSDPACDDFDPSGQDPSQNNGIMCRIGQRPVSIIDPTTLARTQVGCVDDGRVGWGEKRPE